jgi:hypothetical protein
MLAQIVFFSLANLCHALDAIAKHGKVGSLLQAGTICPWPLSVRSQGRLHSSFTIYNNNFVFSKMDQFFRHAKIP